MARSHERTQYYHRKSSDDKHGSYIPCAQQDLARQLAQKEYDTRVVRIASWQKSAIERLLNNPSYGLVENSIEGILDTVNQHKRDLIAPYAVSDERFARQWHAVAFEPDVFALGEMAFTTEKGERVRSKSEVIIANLLSSRGVYYHYEKPLMLDRGLCVHPDFTVLNARTRKEYVWEHFGMMDNPEYCNNTIRKITAYGLAGYPLGIKLIATFESREFPLSTQIVDLLIREYLL